MAINETNCEVSNRKIKNVSTLNFIIIIPLDAASSAKALSCLGLENFRLGSLWTPPTKSMCSAMYLMKEVEKITYKSARFRPSGEGFL